MKIIRTLKVTADEFFEQIESALLAQVVRATGQDALDASVIKAGYRFVERADDAICRSETQIIEYVPGVRFKSRTVTAGDDVVMSYEVESTEKNDGISVTYRQEMKSFEERKRGFMKSFSEAVYLGRMAESLFKIQDAVLEAREGIERLA